MESPARTFAGHASRGELAYQVDAAGLPLWPPQVRGAGWRVSDGLGTVHATTTIRRAGEDPYDLSLVDLDEGVRLMSRIVGIAPDAVRVGMRVRLAWDGEVPVFVEDLAQGARAPSPGAPSPGSDGL
ncbi:OB-fold domain-containing protein [Paraconexibacter antarcticus]|uniref:OB-fold domain-containing protein n=1 Tax=Paraconexibacter antarcticus TaxID=2949664 RepID=A0ABY5DQC0_9ACTN|nr:OB-fold domain-containing protein [Paraconexibacter antarcticus]UTI64220.1 OB-fold domain-containing protein [Paraconexibacter antarcticus]